MHHLLYEVGLLHQNVIHSAPVINRFNDFWERGFDLVDDDLVGQSDVRLYFKLDACKLSGNFVKFGVAITALVLCKLQRLEYFIAAIDEVNDAVIARHNLVEQLLGADSTEA